MISKFIGYFVCAIALMMPWKLRIIFSEILGWITQAIFYTYYGILAFMIKELKKDNVEGRKDE